MVRYSAVGKIGAAEHAEIKRWEVMLEKKIIELELRTWKRVRVVSVTSTLHKSFIVRLGDKWLNARGRLLCRGKLIC